MKNKTILLTLMALTIISVTVMTVSCRKELKITPDNTVQFTGDRTVHENEVITKLCLDTVVRTDFYGLTNEQAAEAAAFAIKGFYDHYSISLPTTLSSIEDQFEYYVTNLVLADPNTVWTGTISLIYDSLTAGELGIIEEARGIFTQDFSSMTSSEICEKISDDAEYLLVEHSLNGEDSLLASTLMPVIMGASEYCLALSDGVPADSMAKIIQAGATGYIVGHAAALLLNLEDGLARIDNGIFMAGFAGGLAAKKIFVLSIPSTSDTTEIETGYFSRINTAVDFPDNNITVYCTDTPVIANGTGYFTATIDNPIFSVPSNNDPFLTVKSGVTPKKIIGRLNDYSGNTGTLVVQCLTDTTTCFTVYGVSSFKKIAVDVQNNKLYTAEEFTIQKDINLNSLSVNLSLSAATSLNLSTYFHSEGGGQINVSTGYYDKTYYGWARYEDRGGGIYFITCYPSPYKCVTLIY